MSRPTIRSDELLPRLGYEYYLFGQEGERPEYSEKTFADILPGLGEARSDRGRKLAPQRLYKHQEEAFRTLAEGLNLILRSGTGSGKTEAWFLASAHRGLKTLVIYPTLALAEDQYGRLRDYGGDLGIPVMAIDALKRQELAERHGVQNLRKMISGSQILLTNPAYLLNEVKKIILGRGSILREFLEKLDLIVVDDFDFYGPREIALLFSMLKLLKEATGRRPQYAFMTAALENPGDVAEYLTSINGRETRIISGKAFKAPNKTYIVLGKDLRRFWEEARRWRDRLEEAGVGEDVLEALEDYGEFRKNFYKVWDALRYAGVSVPEPWPDPAEIISEYLFDNVVTLVFTRSIARAEEIVRRIVQRTGRRERIAAHHHLLEKRYRREVEEAVKNGLIKVIVSPRTLSQGIDIGAVHRVVHIGLPDEVREFYQREGRKGRRPEIEETETIIIPSSLWDNDLLSRGVETLRKWVELPLERIIVNPGNKYSTLFEALAKIQSPRLREKLTKEELELLRGLGLERGLELTGLGKKVWRQMNFYEFAPPYGVKRIKIDEDGYERRLEDISHCDLVEKFQPGSIDYTSDSIVTHHRLSERTRAVTAVVVEPLREGVLRRNEGTAYALEEYIRLKSAWGEEPNILRDYYLGRLHSTVFCVVHPPTNGFGRYVKIPNRVEWVLLAERKKMIRRDGETVFYRDRRNLVVPSPTYGKYEDYTYGIVVEADIEDDPELLRIGLAYITIVLRRRLGIAFETILYDVIRLSERKFIALHEPESAGLIERLDWSMVYREVEAYEPDELDEIFLAEIDEYAYSSFTSKGLDWRLARRMALRVLDHLRVRERLRLEFMGRRLEVPKPSRSLRIASLTGLYIRLREDLNAGIYALDLFDGEEHYYASGISELSHPDEGYLGLHQRLSQLLDQGFRLTIYSMRVLGGVFEEAGIRGLEAALRGAESIGKLSQVSEELAGQLGWRPPLEELKRSILGEVSPTVSELTGRLEDVKRRQPGVRRMEAVKDRLDPELMEYLSKEAEAIYLASLAVKSLGKVAEQVGGSKDIK